MNQVYREILNSITLFYKEKEKLINAQLEFSRNFIGFKGHFENNPILPGYCLIETSKVFLEKQTSGKVKIYDIKEAKFYKPIFPEEKLNVKVYYSSGPTSSGNTLYKFEFTTFKETKAVLKLSI